VNNMECNGLVDGKVVIRSWADICVGDVLVMK
jgi:hypothetical protein